MDLDYTQFKNIGSPEHHMTDYFRLADGGIFFKRMQYIREPRHIFDVFSQFWGVMVADVPPDTLAVKTRGTFIPISGPSAVLVLPSTLVEWVFHKPVEIEWHALTYRAPVPKSLPACGCLTQLPPAAWPTSKAEVEEIFSEKRGLVSIEKQEIYNPLALKLKRLIDANFTEDKSIENYAEELNIHPDVLRRYFRKCYDLTPVEYRNQLRLFCSLVNLLFDSPQVTDISSAAGFKNLKNFNKQFYNFAKLQPSKLKSHWQKKDPSADT